MEDLLLDQVATVCVKQMSMSIEGILSVCFVPLLTVVLLTLWFRFVVRSEVDKYFSVLLFPKYCFSLSRSPSTSTMALTNVLLLSQIAGYVMGLILSLCVVVPMSMHQDEFK